METVAFDTSQNVRVKYKVAGIGDRVLAAMIDLLVIFAFSVVIILLGSFVRKISQQYWITFMSIFFLPVMFYHLICEVWMNGQSIGKKNANIKVVRIDGSQATFICYFLRWLFRIIDIDLSGGSVALITMIINGKGQRLGDMAAGTTVVETKSAISLKDTIFETIEDNYKVVFPEAGQLDDKIIELIKEVLNTNIDYNRHRFVDINLYLKTQKMVEKKTGIKSHMHPKKFLTTVIKDYNYLKSRY